MTDNAAPIRSAAVAAHAETWRYLEMPTRTAAENAAMVAAAERSLDLWRKVGTPVNEQRGEWLVARANVVADSTGPALDHALKTLELTATHKDALEDFDLAFAEEVAARAFALAGDRPRAARHYRAARNLGNAIKDGADRRVFFEQFEAGPWFGLDP